MNTLRVNAERARLFRPAAEHHRVVFLHEALGDYSIGGVEPGHKADALARHKLNAAADNGFRQLHVRDAIHQKPAGQRALLDHRDAVAPVVELIGDCKPRRAGAHHRHIFPRAVGREARLHQVVGKGVFDDAQFVVMHRDGIAVEPAGAGLLTESGADAPGEFGEVICFEKSCQCVGEVPVHDAVVPLRDQIVQRAAELLSIKLYPGLTERDAAVHTPCTLLAPLLLGTRKMKLLLVLYPLQRRTHRIRPAFIFQKSGRFSHIIHLLNDLRRRKTP